MARVVVFSWWRNDAGRDVVARAAHLLAKTYPGIRWVWFVGDSQDETQERLEGIAEHSGLPVEVVRDDTGIDDSEPAEHLRVLSRTMTTALASVRDEDDWCLIHESDLVTPEDVVERYLAAAELIRVGQMLTEERASPVGIAGWVTLGDGGMFYDTFAYRGLDGAQFTNNPPYHADHRAHSYEVASVGSCWLFPAQLARGIVLERYACIELCRKLREEGCRFFVDPSIPVVQPEAMWVSRSQAPVPA